VELSESVCCDACTGDSPIDQLILPLQGVIAPFLASGMYIVVNGRCQ
jgi:hypothetical protein